MRAGPIQPLCPRVTVADIVAVLIVEPLGVARLGKTPPDRRHVANVDRRVVIGRRLVGATRGRAGVSVPPSIGLSGSATVATMLTGREEAASILIVDTRAAADS